MCSVSPRRRSTLDAQESRPAVIERDALHRRDGRCRNKHIIYSIRIHCTDSAGFVLVHASQVIASD